MKQYCKIETLNFPIDGYQFNVQIWRSVDGVRFYYCGCGKYFRTMEEAEKYAADNTIE